MEFTEASQKPSLIPSYHRKLQDSIPHSVLQHNPAQLEPDESGNTSECFKLLQKVPSPSLCGHS